MHSKIHKKILYIILLFLIPVTFLVSNNYSFATSNLEVWWEIWNEDKNSRLNNFFADKFITFWSYWDQWLTDVIVLGAKDLKNIFYIIAGLYFLIISLRLILSSNTEESVGNFKKWIIWITVW
jgi:hypothetical protein